MCVDRLLESWDTMQHFLNEMVVCDKTKSAEPLLACMINVETKAYFLFLKYILNYFNSFNAFFQAIETRIHLLQSKSVNLLVQISQNFLKPESLKHLLTNTSFQDKNNHKSLCDITLGSDCDEYLCDLMTEGYEDVITNIRQNCLTFYVTAAEEIRKRLPVNNAFLYKLKVFQPQTALFDSDRVTSFNDVSYIAKTIHGFDEDGLKQEWLTLHSDFTIEEKQTLATLNFDGMWKKILKSQCNSIFKYPNLTSFINAIRSLPNSNADPERTFSLLTDLKTKKRNRLSAASINATCVFKSALKTRGETALTMKITQRHIQLMCTENLYAPAVKKPKSSLTLYAEGNDIPGLPSSNDTQ